MTVSKNTSLQSVAPWIFTSPTPPPPPSTPISVSKPSWYRIKYSNKNDELINRLVKASIPHIATEIANNKSLMFSPEGLPSHPQRNFTAITPRDFFLKKNHLLFTEEKIFTPKATSNPYSTLP